MNVFRSPPFTCILNHSSSACFLTWTQNLVQLIKFLNKNLLELNKETQTQFYSTCTFFSVAMWCDVMSALFFFFFWNKVLQGNSRCSYVGLVTLTSMSQMLGLQVYTLASALLVCPWCSCFLAMTSFYVPFASQLTVICLLLSPLTAQC